MKKIYYKIVAKIAQRQEEKRLFSEYKEDHAVKCRHNLFKPDTTMELLGVGYEKGKLCETYGCIICEKIKHYYV